mmetsp:Transcript_16124/g.65134  ORF Transcript_16124/g.65134 Transcript_16124/m.65134 type:complete len:335 (-) Transcript_16124:1290-2294(-)
MVAAVISSASESEPLSIAAQQRLARRVARLVPTKLVQCDLGLTPTGAFCVGTFAAPKAYQPRPAAVALAEAERARRVAAHGTRPVVSPTLQAVGAELPRNLVSCGSQSPSAACESGENLARREIQVRAITVSRGPFVVSFQMRPRADGVRRLRDALDGALVEGAAQDGRAERPRPAPRRRRRRPFRRAPAQGRLDRLVRCLPAQAAGRRAAAALLLAHLGHRLGLRRRPPRPRRVLRMAAPRRQDREQAHASSPLAPTRRSLLGSSKVSIDRHSRHFFSFFLFGQLILYRPDSGLHLSSARHASAHPARVKTHATRASVPMFHVASQPPRWQQE